MIPKAEIRIMRFPQEQLGKMFQKDGSVPSAVQKKRLLPS
jgi:hypothetical protein